MSSTSRSDNSYRADVDELLQLRTMCKELKKEKDMMKESLLQEKSKNAELIRRLQSGTNAASDAQLKDERYVEELERELRNCSQEIGYLQDQLNLRNVESNCMGEHVHSLELKLAEVGTLHEKLRLLTEELFQSDSKRLILMREIKNKEEELQNSALLIEELEAAVSSIALESQCEIESIRLEITALEERCFEAERFGHQASQEKAKMDVLLEEFESKFLEAQGTISYLEKENKELKERLATYETNGNVSHCKVEEHLDNWLKRNNRMNVFLRGRSIQDLLAELRKEIPLVKEICTCHEVSCPSKPAVVTAWDDNAKDEMEKMSNQIHESEILVAQLKEELREEKLKAKEEAEDLTQAMAELRYQIMGMLEEECKRRACIEQTSLRRIQDLEEQVRKEQKKSFAAIRRFREVHQLAEMRSEEVRHLKHALEVFCQRKNSETAHTIEPCTCGVCTVKSSDCLNEVPVATDTDALKGTSNGNSFDQRLLEWHPDDKAP